MAKNETPKLNLDQQGLDELRYIQQVYQNQYTMMGNNINLLIQEVQQLNSAQKTIENLALVKGKEVITNIGSDFYLFGKVQNPDAILVGVGAGYLVEKDPQGAGEYVSDLLKKRSESLNAMTKSRKEIESALMEISYRLENPR
jgi:prefoldin alpha subunit